MLQRTETLLVQVKAVHNKPMPKCWFIVNGTPGTIGVKHVFVFDSFQAAYLHFTEIKSVSRYLHFIDNGVFVLWGKFYHYHLKQHPD